MKRTIQLFANIALLLLGSCLKEQELGIVLPSSELLETNLSTIHIPVSQVPFFANVAGFNLVPTTIATRASEETVTLKSLLNMSDAQERVFKGMSFRQIPFKQNDEELLATVREDLETDIDSATVLKKYYVTVSATEETYEYIVTMATEFQFAKFHPDFNYLQKADYSGIIIFSSLMGEILGVRSYEGGQANAAILLTKDEISSDEYESMKYIQWFKESVSTRAATNTEKELDGGILEGSVCVAEKKKKTIDDDPWDLEEYRPNDLIGGGGGSGSGNAGSGDGGKGKKPKILPLIEYKVSLTTNLPEYINMIGSGSYEDGSAIYIGFSYKYSPSQIPFSRWTGDFSDKNTVSFMHIVTKTVVSTACFDYSSPCRDKSRKMTNPVHIMSVAATGSGSYYGGTFGMTRNNHNKRHTGIDLAADPGTPLYATYSGTVYNVTSNLPNKNVDYSYGNEIVIKCCINGQYYYFYYTHLQYGTPIAINPRTNEPFKKGDEVFDGDLIAYSGKTGNAFDDEDVPNKHLHLGVGTNWDKDHRRVNWIDPRPFLNGTIDVDYKKQTSSRFFYNIICD